MFYNHRYKVPINLQSETDLTFETNNKLCICTVQIESCIPFNLENMHFTYIIPLGTHSFNFSIGLVKSIAIFSTNKKTKLFMFVCGQIKTDYIKQ